MRILLSWRVSKLYLFIKTYYSVGFRKSNFKMEMIAFK
jgi:hypothetical protein